MPEITHELVVSCPSVRWAEWKRSLLVADDGGLYAPAVAAGVTEAVAFYTAAYDGIAFIRHKKHLFLPLSWMRREYPEERELWDVMEKRARTALANGEEKS